ncbi:MAG: stage II sporulation protein M [Armatimonadota bacterium]
MATGLPGTPVFNEEAYLHKRLEGWSRLEQLLRQGGAGLRGLAGEQMVEAVRLYRQASGDLAYLSTHSSNADVVDYLNNLVGRAYTEIYRLPPKDARAVIADSLKVAAQTVRRRSPEIFFGMGIFFFAMFFAWILMAAVPSTREFFVPPGAEELFAHWKSGQHMMESGGDSLARASMYSTNNPMVAIMMVGTSLATAGLMGIVNMWTNGVLVGALAAECATTGATFFLFSSILPHGVSELGGFFVSSGASFLLGRTVISPGDRTRGEALRAVGKEASTLAIVGLVMIFLAAPIEGFFSFNPLIPQWFKLIVGLLALGAWLAFFIGYGREPNAPPKLG